MKLHIRLLLIPFFPKMVKLSIAWLKFYHIHFITFTFSFNREITQGSVLLNTKGIGGRRRRER